MSSTATPASSPQSEHVLETIKIWSRSSFLLMVLTVGSTSFHGWGALATLILGLGTAVLALLTMIKMIKAKFPGFSLILMILVMLWSLFLSFAAGLQLIFFDASLAYAECFQQALTLERQQRCATEMSDGLMQQLLGR